MSAKSATAAPRKRGKCAKCQHGTGPQGHPVTGCGFCRNQAKPGPCAQPAAKPAKPALARAAKPAPVAKPVVVCGCGCGAQAKPGRRFVQGHDARKLPWFVAQAAKSMLGDADAALVARRAKRAGPVLGVLADQAADSIRHRDSGDWASIPADSIEFRREVASLVASVLYETS